MVKDSKHDTPTLLGPLQGRFPLIQRSSRLCVLSGLLFQPLQDLLLSPKLNGGCEGKGEKCGHYLNGAAVGQVVLSLLRLQCLILLRVYGQVASSLQNQTCRSYLQET